MDESIIDVPSRNLTHDLSGLQMHADKILKGQILSRTWAELRNTPDLQTPPLRDEELVGSVASSHRSQGSTPDLYAPAARVEEDNGSGISGHIKEHAKSKMQQLLGRVVCLTL
jgi:hypothetical protein